MADSKVIKITVNIPENLSDRELQVIQQKCLEKLRTVAKRWT